MATGSRFIIYYVTGDGEGLALRVRSEFPEAECVRFEPGTVERHWDTARALVFITAAGIAVRSVAPLLRDKSSDPAVVVLDEKGGHVVSLLGGHEAGANELANRIARIVGAEPVITTATDANKLDAVDVFARKNGLVVENRQMLPAASALHIRKGHLNVYSESPLTFPDGLRAVDRPDDADVVITHRVLDTDALVLRPLNLVLGIGLNTGTSAEEINEAVEALCREHGLSSASLRLVATHEKKKTEPGLREFAKKRGIELRGFAAGELNSVEGVEESGAAKKALGVKAVAEPAAILASGAEELLVRKNTSGNVTLAVCVWRSNKLYVAGTGPGGLEHITPQALSAIRESDVVVGYKSYLKLIEPLLEGKEVLSSAMTEEVSRANGAVDLALKGKRVCMVSGGDPGVYAMAGLVFEVVRSRGLPLEVEVVPGVSALNACAARLGAPLMHDFAAISLSDRLTPWERIEERLDAAARSDFVIVLYNPKSRGRATHIGRAIDIILGHRPPDTPVGIVKSAMREDEEVAVTTLGEVLRFDIDMKTTVVVGNSMSYRWRDRLITPRGYGRKYEL